MSGCWRTARPGRDPYIRFGQHGGLLPEGASKQTHPLLRDRLKVAALATLYGQTEASLAPRLGIPVHAARRLLDLHAATLPDVLALAARLCARRHGGGSGLDQAGLGNGGQCADPHHQPDELADAKPRQRDAADRDGDGDGGRHPNLHPGHDALLVEAPEADADAVADRMRAIMTKASELLIGVPCRIDIKPIRAGERYVDDRGVAMWERMLRALAEAEAAATGNLIQVLAVPKVPADVLTTAG